MSVRHCIELCALIVLLGAESLGAVSTVGIGKQQDSHLQTWTQAMESARFVAVEPDSVRMWHVQPNSNLATGIQERGGVLRMGGPVDGLRLFGGEVMYDGDAGTAFDPDDFPDLNRSTPLFIDLGGTFRVNRIRFSPRLDSQSRHQFLQEFSLSVSDGADKKAAFTPLFSMHNRTPVVDKRFASQDVRYIQLVPAGNRAWEIAELEVYGDGTVPLGEYISVPLPVSAKRPVWGEVRFEGGPIPLAPVEVQTRTGPDAEPMHYFRRVSSGDEGLERISKAEYLELKTLIENKEEGVDPDALGPIRPNPAWSLWETTSEGIVASPDLQSYIQFRVLFSVPGAGLKMLAVEYVQPPLVDDLAAEIDPVKVEPGQETQFTLSMEVRLKTTGFSWERDTGFDRLQVRTSAQISKVERVLLDDQEISFTPTYEPGQGVTINLGQRIAQSGSFVQVIFQGLLYRDHTRFEVRALDLRQEQEGMDLAYQIARPANVEPGTLTGDLVVRLNKEEREVPLLTGVTPRSRLFTPNGDDIHDFFELRYILLKLLRPAQVSVSIYDLSGRQVRQVYAGQTSVGQYTQVWDGRDQEDRQVAPGLYLYEVRVEAEELTERQQGVVGVAY